MKSANPYLNFKGNTEEAFEFYRSAFGVEFAVVMRFRDFEDGSRGLAEADLDKIAHIAMPLGSSMLMGTDVLESQGQPLHTGNNFYIMLDPDTPEEADRIFNALAAGGKVEMPLQKTEWAEKYGALADRYGVQWMMSYIGDVKLEGLPQG